VPIEFVVRITNRIVSDASLPLCLCPAAFRLSFCLLSCTSLLPCLASTTRCCVARGQAIIKSTVKLSRFIGSGVEKLGLSFRFTTGAGETGWKARGISSSLTTTVLVSDRKNVPVQLAPES
jgi:hypothetical protein